MSLPITLKSSQMLILVGDGGSPEIFAEPCGLTTRSFEFGSDLKQYAVIGGDWDEAVAGALSCSLSGNGVLAVESFAAWNSWAVSRQPRNVHLKLEGIGTYIGTFLLTQLSLQGSHGARVSIEVSMRSSGALVLQIQGIYTDTITPAALPIGGQTITPVFSGSGRVNYTETITPSAVPIGGQTITPVFSHVGIGYTDTITPAALPIGGQTITPVFVGTSTAGEMFGFFFPLTKAT